ncbi:ribonuclease H-like domain-containing protein [Tanacetum coccineum]
MWLFRHKYLADGSLSRYKARLVANSSTQLDVHQLDVKNAFLHGDLSEIVYMHQPSGFRDSAHPNYGANMAYLLLYVDDIVLTASSKILLQQIIASLHQEFSMTDLNSLNYFISISVTRDDSGMFLSQRKYAAKILERAHMVNYNSSRTPVDTESKLGDDCDLIFLKWILRYVRDTLDHGLQIFSSLVAYSDFDWAGCPTTRQATLGYYVFLGNNLLSWSSKRQLVLSRSSVEAEYRGVANVVAETCWLRNHLRELQTPLSSAMLIYCDNVSVVYLFELFTKVLRSALFEEFCSSLSVLCPPALLVDQSTLNNLL